jgi:hypothetical protein
MMTTATVDVFAAVSDKLSGSGAATAIDADGPILPIADMSFFSSTGLRNLMFAMLKQSIKDHIKNVENKHAPAEIAASARWLNAAGGHACIQFLMPGVTPGFVTAKIFANPQEILKAIEQGELTKEEAAGFAAVMSEAFVVSSAAASADMQHALRRADDSDGDEAQDHAEGHRG